MNTQSTLVPLGVARPGWRGIIRALRPFDGPALSAAELERRLVELGFVEGASVQALHEGPFGRDPIAVRVDGTTFALRRREANAVLVEIEQANTPEHAE